MDRNSLYNKSLDELVSEDKKLSKMSNYSRKESDSRDFNRRDSYRMKRDRSLSNDYRGRGSDRGKYQF